MKNPFLSPKATLPLALFLGLSIMGLRMADMWETVTTGKLTVHSAMAESAKPAAAKEAVAAPAAKAEAKPDAHAEAAKEEDAAPQDEEKSPAEMELLKQLSQRREQLEKRSRDLDDRDALMKITEQRIDQKMKELETLRTQLQSMVTNANEAQQAQIENLVKIYETMKPDEAAKIFETLDMPVLLGVIQKMKPARTAPILAKMAPEKAREITVALTKQDQLPQVK